MVSVKLQAAALTRRCPWWSPSSYAGADSGVAAAIPETAVDRFDAPEKPDDSRTACRASSSLFGVSPHRPRGHGGQAAWQRCSFLRGTPRGGVTPLDGLRTGLPADLSAVRPSTSNGRFQDYFYVQTLLRL